MQEEAAGRQAEGTRCGGSWILDAWTHDTSWQMAASQILVVVGTALAGHTIAT